MYPSIQLAYNIDASTIVYFDDADDLWRTYKLRMDEIFISPEPPTQCDPQKNHCGFITHHALGVRRYKEMSAKHPDNC